MRRQIVIEFPDDASDRMYNDVVAAVTSVVRAVAGAAGTAVPEVRFHSTGPVARVEPHPHPPHFTVELRGYDRGQVDDWVNLVRTAPPPYPAPGFQVTLRGYRRSQVDAWVSRITGG